MQNETGPSSHTINHCKCRYKTVLEENTRGKLQYIGVGNNYLDMSPKPQAIKAEIDRWDCLKLKKKLLPSKGNT